MNNQISVGDQNTQQLGNTTVIQQNQIAQKPENQNGEFTKKRSLFNQRLVKFLVVSAISSLIVIFLMLPVVKFVSRLPLFQQLNFFPGMAESFAIIPSISLLILITLTMTKITLKEWKYVVASFLVMIATIITISLIGSYRTNKFFQGLHKELDQSIEISKQTQITITNFDELPSYDSSQKLTNISFGIEFISNMTQDMNITPKVRFKGKHVQGNESLFWFDPTEITFDSKTEPYDYKSFYNIEANKLHKIIFTFSNLSKGVEDMTSELGNFQVGIIFSGHTRDPLGYGQGNATEINDIIDQTGKSVKEEFAGEVLHFNSKDFRLKSL